jgi:citronellol/citronellal dehydrogenase
MCYQSVFKDSLFAGKNFVVTGGGSGIGRCCAHELASLGAHVTLIGRNIEKLESVQAEITEDGGSADFFSVDIRNEEKVAATVKTIVEKHNVIHGLLNNAGGQYPSPLEKLTKKGFDAVVQNNLTGGFLFAREIYNQSMVNHGGSIINIIADMFGGMPNMGHSGAARAGMENLTKTAAFEWGKSGVRVNAIAPGWIISSGMDTYDESFQNTLLTIKEAVPLKRMGTESEISGAVCFLFSESSAFISGTTLRIDGAASLGNRVWPLEPAKNNTAYDGFHRATLPEMFKKDK